MAKTPKSMPCIARCSDGSPCGRRVKNGDGTQFCHLHEHVAQGNPFNGGTPKPFVAKDAKPDPVALLEKLMRDPDPSIRLRAVNAYLDRQEKQQGCLTCRGREDFSDAVRRLTPDQREEAAWLIAAMRDLLDKARQQPVYVAPLPVVPEPLPVVPEPLLAPVAPTQQSTDEPEPAPFQLPKDKWAAVGLCVVNKIVTHAQGDEHAQKILTGEIPYDEAKRDHALRSDSRVDRSLLQEAFHD